MNFGQDNSFWNVFVVGFVLSSPLILQLKVSSHKFQMRKNKNHFIFVKILKSFKFWSDTEISEKVSLHTIWFFNGKLQAHFCNLNLAIQSFLKLCNSSSSFTLVTKLSTYQNSRSFLAVDLRYSGTSLINFVKVAPNGKGLLDIQKTSLLCLYIFKNPGFPFSHHRNKNFFKNLDL